MAMSLINILLLYITVSYSVNITDRIQVSDPKMYPKTLPQAAVGAYSEI